MVVEIAVVILAIAAVASNYGFYIAIQNEMQKFGETIVTTKGPGSSTFSTLPPPTIICPGSNLFSYPTAMI